MAHLARLRSLPLTLLAWGAAAIFSSFLSSQALGAPLQPAEFASGFQALDSGKDDEAIALFKAGLKKAPKNALAHFYLGVAYEHKRNLELSQNEFRSATVLGLPEPQATYATNKLQKRDAPSSATSERAAALDLLARRTEWMAGSDSKSDEDMDCSVRWTVESFKVADDVLEIKLKSVLKDEGAEYPPIVRSSTPVYRWDASITHLSTIRVPLKAVKPIAVEKLITPYSCRQGTLGESWKVLRFRCKDAQKCIEGENVATEEIRENTRPGSEAVIRGKVDRNRIFLPRTAPNVKNNSDPSEMASFPLTIPPSADKQDVEEFGKALGQLVPK